MRSVRAPGSEGGRPKRQEAGHPAGLWPAGPGGLRGGIPRALLLLFLFATPGCGGATAPCPTPTTELDRLRTESERLEREMDEASSADDAANEEREEAMRRVAEAEAALDSIADARAR
ncbi:MAG TPA: hypothetical protein VFV24_11425 [Candidatus Eisenbacteria bacterium]|nr:hypothetical protein [Candidatus Eisenbacteria bacterium]